MHPQKETSFQGLKDEIRQISTYNPSVYSALSLAPWQVKYLQVELCNPLYNLFELQSVCFNYLL